jgi:prepilin-type processing-associated H-X9-DG protein
LTLLELLAVLVVVGLVVALVLPLVNTAREKRNRSMCASNLRQIGVALLAYAHDHQQHLPTIYYNAGTSTWDRALLNRQYLSALTFGCPSDRWPRPEGQLPRTYALSGGRQAVHDLFWIQGARITCPALSNHAAIVLVGERAPQDNPGVVGGIASAWCDMTYLASAHAADKRSNYLFLDGHVAWVEPVTEARLDAMFPVNPDGPVPCP